MKILNILRNFIFKTLRLTASKTAATASLPSGRTAVATKTAPLLSNNQYRAARNIEIYIIKQDIYLFP